MMNDGNAMAAPMAASGHRWPRGMRAAGVAFVTAVLLAACGVPNNPNPPGSEATNTYFTATQESSPKYLDPTSSYSANETPFVFAVYEPLLRYHYLKRPYQLEPRIAEELPVPRYYDKDGHEMPADAPGDQVAESVYDIRIRKGVLFAPHPAFAKNPDGSFVYAGLKASDVDGKFALSDFPKTGTRELVADDFVYGIKRMATPRVKSSAFSVMNEYIVGMKDYAKRVRVVDAQLRKGIAPTQRDLPYLDFRQIPFEGATAVDPYTLRIRVVGKYPQFKYWLAMTFFAPVPWEAEAFYAQPGMIEHNLSLNYWPAGTGPFMATEYIENRRHTLVRNPNYRGDPYPCEGEPGDKEKGLLDDCGKKTPFVDKVVFRIEKERLPMKSKWRQGYLDEPDMDHLEWGLEFSSEARDSDATAREFAEKGFRFPRAVEAVNWYIGFNWWDPVVGKGKTAADIERNRKVRQALQIAVDWDEFSDLFEQQGKAGPAATGPLPPVVFGFRTGKEGMNPLAYDWQDGPGGGRAVRKPLAIAQKLMEEAGYPGGRDAKTGQPLVLNYDYQRVPTPELRAEIDWVIKQFAKLGIQLELRATDYNRSPGQDEQRFGTGVLLGLERRLPGRRELPLPALRTELEGVDEGTGRERDQLPERRVRPPLREDALHGGRPREAGDDRPDGRHRPPGFAVVVGIQPVLGRLVPAVDEQRQADLHGPQHARVPAHRPRDARAAGRAVEPAAFLAALGDRARVPARPLAGVARVQGA